MKKLFLILVLGLLWSGSAYADPVKTSWIVSKAIVDGVFADSDEIVGKSQKFLKEKSEGIFYNCGFGEGEVSNYSTYAFEEFFNNKEFKIFLNNRDKLNFPIDKKIYVEKLTCADNKAVLYPFIQFEDSNIAYYEFNLGIFELTKN